MRRSKVQRQEARREKLSRFRGPGKKEEKSAPQLYTVVRTDDARQGKYLWCEHEGITLEHAERLAAPVPGQAQAYTVVPVDVHRFARSLGEPISPKAATAKFKAQVAA